METNYVAMFPSRTDRPATPFRMALGVLIIQKQETTLSSIAMSILVTNLFAVDISGIFLLYFSDNITDEKTEHYIIIDDAV